MDKLSELANDTAVHKAQFARQNEHNAQQEAEIKFLRGQVETLTKINDQSHNIRMRFISKYKRDVLNKATSTDHDAIDAGNIDTHEGNARGDAMLYKLRKRFDEVIYIDLYGLGWSLVLNLSKFFLPFIILRSRESRGLVIREPWVDLWKTDECATPYRISIHPSQEFS